MSAIEWIKPVIDYNAIRFTNKSKTIDFDLWVIKVDENGDKSAVDLRYGSTRQTFVALFDDKETDFEIKVYNGSHTRMAFDIVFGKTYPFYISAGHKFRFKTLQNNGHHLRFLSPNLPTGQSVVDMIANKDPDSRRNAEIMCSRMKFKLGVERPLIEEGIKPLDNNIGHYWSHPSVLTDCIDNEIVVFINDLDKIPFNLIISPQMTVDELKHLIQKRTGYPFDRQILICDGIELEDHKTIGESKIGNYSMIYLVRLNIENTAIVSSHEKPFNKETVAKVVPKLKANVEYMGEVINVFVRTLQSKTIILRIGRLNTLYDLKLLIQEREGIHCNEIRLRYIGKELNNDKTIDENHITNNSTINLSARLKGGLKRQSSSQRPDPTIDTNLLDIPVVNKYVGKRGVIGFGDKTNEKLGPYVHNYYMESFFIEFRLKNQFN